MVNVTFNSERRETQLSGEEGVDADADPVLARSLLHVDCADHIDQSCEQTTVRAIVASAPYGADVQRMKRETVGAR
jgi:hypothetical protein